MNLLKKLFGNRSNSAVATRPNNSKADADQGISTALKNAGYKPTFERPTDPDSIVNTVVQAMLARETCKTEGTFETGEKNPQRILCSDDECPCSDCKQLFIGSTAYLYISQAVVDFRKECRTLMEREVTLQNAGKRLGANTMILKQGAANPVYLCETGARRRGLDLAVALADAKTVADTGFAPLRPTPRTGR